MAGLRERANIWRVSYPTDSPSGGAMPSGTLQYSSVMTEMDAVKPSTILLQQGIETEEVFTAIVIPVTLTIYEKDEYEPCFPFNHPFLNKRFRIVSVRRSTNLPFSQNGYLLLTMTRSDQAHSEQGQ